MQPTTLAPLAPPLAPWRAAGVFDSDVAGLEAAEERARLHAVGAWVLPQAFLLL